MSLHWTEEEYKEFLARRSRDKPQPEPKPKSAGRIPHKRTEVNGMKFDSLHEAGVYQDLLLRQTVGEIRCILRQVPFDLPGGIVYKADFVVIGNDMKIEAVIDAKSEYTKKDRIYINKKKQVQALYGITIEEV